VSIVVPGWPGCRGELNSPSVDAYLRKAPAFAQPIIEHLREVVHAACPEVEECPRTRVKQMPAIPSVHHSSARSGSMAWYSASKGRNSSL
jgi:hypothetical protein